MLLIKAAALQGGVLGSGLALVFPEHGASERGLRVAPCGKRSHGREMGKWAGKTGENARPKEIPELKPEMSSSAEAGSFRSQLHAGL